MMNTDAHWLLSPEFHNRAITAAMWWFIVIWLASLGGCVGSFLNVVWDRWGTARGVVFPRSCCSNCGHPIRWYHNLPILGWFLLRGRCYDCGAKISPKHLIVETLLAGLFIIAGIASPWL
jgi:leader peptidase (prepilin peptidase)/N-methyltransferase